MRTLHLLLLFALGFVHAPLALAAEATDEEVAARMTALDLAGAFANDGFKLRDGHLDRTVGPDKPLVIQVNLFVGNEYWFTAASAKEGVKLAISVHDETGKPMDFELFQDGSRAAAGFAPDQSGPYFLKITQVEGEPSTVCLIYSYK